MDLKLTEQVRNTISLLYREKTGFKFDIWNFLVKKIKKQKNKKQCWPIFRRKSTFSGRSCFITSLWRHTLTDFLDFGINGKRRPYHILKRWVTCHLICIIMAAILEFLGYVGYGSYQYLKIHRALFFKNVIMFEPELRFLLNKNYLKAKIALYFNIYKAKMAAFNLFRV